MSETATEPLYVETADLRKRCSLVPIDKLRSSPMIKWKRATSHAFENTPNSLYRFLYLWEPETMDFSDMYKSVLAFISLNGKGLMRLEFYKYELAAYYYVPKEELKPQLQRLIEVSCGVPGTEDVEFIEGSIAKKEFEEFITLLESTLDVYSGNDFFV
jgi:hypothetical protein